MGLNKKAELDFLVYANAVIKSRAISDSADNLKPVHRRILFTLWDMGLDHTHKTTKSANVIGSAMTLHPHGDSSIYDAMIRLAQPWKMRYPLVDIQGNAGNILGYNAAASRYTECRLSPVGDYMLEDINKDTIEFKPNYDGSKQEPVVLPSMFPNILCNGNSGIAVGLSASIVPHNYNEVADAIKHAIGNAGEIGNFIKGPDFPTGGVIVNGEELEQIAATGRGTIKLQSKYRIEKTGGKIHLVFTEIPYLVTIEDGIIEPIKRLVNEEGYDMFDNIINNTNEKSIEIRVVLSKGADSDQALAVLFSNTKLETTVKVNNMVIQKGSPIVLTLKDMVNTYIQNRHIVIQRKANNEYEGLSSKLHVALGLEKCTSNIDLLVKIVREANDKDDARKKLCESFDIDTVQADAILDMKIMKLNRLDIQDLQNTIKELEDKISDLKDIVQNEARRSKIIIEQLEFMRKEIGDKRRTEIQTTQPINKIKDTDDKIEKWYSVKKNGIFVSKDTDNAGLIQVLKTNTAANIVSYNLEGDFMAIDKLQGEISGAFVRKDKPYIMTITKQGYMKKTSVDEYNFNRMSKGLKLKDKDCIITAAYVDDDDFILLLTGDQAVKIPVRDIEATTKLTFGVRVGVKDFVTALIVNDADFVMMMDKDNHGKITSVRDFNENNRTSDGQKIAPNTRFMKLATDRENFIGYLNSGKDFTIARDKFAVKSKTAIGAEITTKTIIDII
jgi:DNA gyrase/topoisomerase IV subunit A